MRRVWMQVGEPSGSEHRGFTVVPQGRPLSRPLLALATSPIIEMSEAVVGRGVCVCIMQTIWGSRSALSGQAHRVRARTDGPWIDVSTTPGAAASSGRSPSGPASTSPTSDAPRSAGRSGLRRDSRWQATLSKHHACVTELARSRIACWPHSWKPHAPPRSWGTPASPRRRRHGRAPSSPRSANASDTPRTVQQQPPRRVRSYLSALHPIPHGGSLAGQFAPWSPTSRGNDSAPHRDAMRLSQRCDALCMMG